MKGVFPKHFHPHIPKAFVRPSDTWARVCPQHAPCLLVMRHHCIFAVFNVPFRTGEYLFRGDQQLVGVLQAPPAHATAVKNQHMPELGQRLVSVAPELRQPEGFPENPVCFRKIGIPPPFPFFNDGNGVSFFGKPQCGDASPEPGADDDIIVVCCIVHCYCI